MRWTSYAQNGEDVVLARVLSDVDAGFWIDVGAQDPRMDSVTCAFAERGWRGINIEPVPHWHAALVAARPRDVNLAVAAGEADARLPFFEVEDSGLSTLDAALADAHRAAGHGVRTGKIAVRTLASICAEHVRGPVHFLKIDAEGAEGAVLRGMDFDAVRPWVVLVEATEPNSRVPTHAAWEPVLLAARYAFAYGDGINRFYLAAEHAPLADRFGPPTVLDHSVRREHIDEVALVSGHLSDVQAELHRHAALVAEKDEALAVEAARYAALAAAEAAKVLALAAAQTARDDALAALAATGERLRVEAEAAAQLRADRAEAEAAAHALHVAHAEDRAREARMVAELDRMHRSAADLQLALEKGQAALAHAELTLAQAEAERADAQAARTQAEAELDRMHRAAADLQLALEKGQAALAHAELTLAQAEAGRAGAQAASARAEAERDAAQGARAQAEAERDAAQAARSQADAERDEAQAARSHAESEREAMQAARDAMAARLQSTELQLVQLATRIPHLQAQLRAAGTAHALAHAELLRHVGLIDGLRAEKAEILASRSWRLTAPLRASNAIVARVRARLARVARARSAGPGPAAPGPEQDMLLPLTEDAARILAQAPVDGRGRR